MSKRFRKLIVIFFLTLKKERCHRDISCKVLIFKLKNYCHTVSTSRNVMCNVAQCVRTFIQALGHAAKRKGKPHNGTFHAMPGCKKRLKSSNIAEIESDTDLRNVPRNIFIELQRVAVHLTENLARNTTCNGFSFAIA